jgi:cation-transporting ATPase E
MMTQMLELTPPSGVVLAEPDAGSAPAGALAGLSAAEVLARRAQGQGNNVALATGRSYQEILRENVFTFINGVLFSIGAVLVALGRVSDAVISVGLVFINVIVSLVQEVRAKRKLDRIALLTRPRATVIRDGRAQEIDPGEIVRGDLLVVHAGDQIVVDGQVVGDGRMDVDESLLTGEADLIVKRAGDPVYSGSFCVTGGATYVAEKVGAASLANQITLGARAFRRVYTPLQREINLVIRVLVLMASFFGILLVTGAIVSDIPLVQSVQMAAVIAGLVPNGLFMAITLAYAIGAVRIATRGALVQQANAVESLSNVDVLCLDKTGTLTANRINLHALYPMGLSEPELRGLLGDYAVSTRDGNRTNDAIVAATTGKPRQVREAVPFSSARKWSALAFDDPALRGVYVLGAPEMLAPAVRIDAEMEARMAAATAEGMRVLLFAYRTDLVPLYDAAEQPQLPAALTPLGVLIFSDELRPEARATLTGFAQAGIKLKIISGDNPHTVAALATQAGLGPDIRVVSGPELAAMDDAQFAQVAEDTTVFGRITPQQKERLVQALRGRGHYVAMIGDGVNDVLSLKQADLGIAMESGSQATRGVADIVLLQDSFAALPAAFQEGQRIRNGMLDIMKLFMTRVLYMALLIVATGIVGPEFPFTPRQSSILVLLTVGIPTLALTVWAQPGAQPRRRGLVRSLLGFVLPAMASLGLVAGGIYLGYFVMNLLALKAANPFVSDAAVFAQILPAARTALITVTVMCGLQLMLFAKPPSATWVGGSPLSGDRRPAWLALALFAVYCLVLVVPALRDMFELAPLALHDFAFVSTVAVLWGLALRYAWRARLLDRFLTVDLS